MKAVLAGNMKATELAFRPLAEMLRERGHDVAAFLAGGGKYPSSLDEMTQSVKSADVVALGMTSRADLAVEELAIASAAAASRIPVALYADSFNGFGRPHFQNFIRDHHPTILVLSEIEAEKGREVHPDVVFVTSGNPDWERYAVPVLSRGDAKERIGLPPSEGPVIQCSGGKDLEVNILHFGAVIEAASQLSPIPVIVLSVHPGDPYKDAPHYGNLKKWSKVPVLIPAVDQSTVLAAADIVVASMATLEIEAGFQRKPVICYRSHTAIVRHEESTGSPAWAPIELGISHEVCGSSVELGHCIRKAMAHDGAFRKQKMDQEKVLIPRKPGTAVSIMADHLESLARPA